MARAMTPPSAPMTPQQALDALGDLPRYEERLEMRTGGLTCMLWGLAIAGIFMTYAAAGGWLVAHGATWAFGVLWVPWVAAGSAASATLWSSHAVTLRRDPDVRHGWALSGAITLAFLVVASALFVALDVVAGVDWTVPSLMALASGVLAAGLGLAMRRAWGRGAWSLVAAGVAILAGAIALGLSGAGETASGLLAAALTGTAWFAAGVATYRKG